MIRGGVVVFGGRQPACILRLAPRHFSSPPFYLFSSASTIKTWLSIIARTQALNRCREITKRDTVPLEDINFIDHIGVADDVLKEETRRALVAAINALGEPEREILIRRYYYDQKPKQIALALDMSAKQVDNRLYQTKLKLREALSD